MKNLMNLSMLGWAMIALAAAGCGSDKDGVKFTGKGKKADQAYTGGVDRPGDTCSQQFFADLDAASNDFGKIVASTVDALKRQQEIINNFRTDYNTVKCINAGNTFDVTAFTDELLKQIDEALNRLNGDSSTPNPEKTAAPSTPGNDGFPGNGDGGAFPQ